MNRNRSEQLYEKAKNYFPGGVNSPVRAFKAVGGSPLFIEKGKGSNIWDADGNKYIDFCCSWGPLILGHANKAVIKNIQKALKKGTSFGAPTALENELAELILNNTKFIEKLRFVSSGTEAVMSALRLARGFTGKNKVIKFEGCYHGHSDSLLVKAGSGLITFGNTSSAGVPKSFAEETIVVSLDDKEAVKKAFFEFKNDVACVIIEPVPANNGLLLQQKEFLMFLRDICTENKALLIFDEVISGFRLGFEGAAGYYDIKPDIITYGKIVGGGLPVGVYGARKDIMSHISPDGAVYQAGTLSGNPVAMAAGIAQLKECLKPDFYSKLEKKTEALVGKINKHAAKNNYTFHMVHIGSIFWPTFSDKKSIKKSSDIDAATMTQFKKLFDILLSKGIYIGPSGYEVGFVSEAHSDGDIKKTAKVFCKALDEVFNTKP